MKRLFATLLFVPVLCWAWTPPKTVNVVIPFTPGSGNEMSFRAVASYVEKKHGMTFVVENIPGADGNVGMNAFGQRPADGQHIAVPSCQSTFVAADIWWRDMMKYEPYDLTMVTNIAKSPLAFIANTSSKVNNLPELIREIKKNDRNINFAIGSSAHKLAYDYFLTNIDGKGKKVVAANYKGPLPAAQDVAGGHAEFGIVPLAVANTLVPTGKIKVIAIAGEKKMKGYEQVELANRHVPGLNVYACWNIVLPKNTDQQITEWYAKEFLEAIQSQQSKKFFEENFMFVDPRALGPVNVRKDMVDLRRQWENYVKQMPSPK